MSKISKACDISSQVRAEVMKRDQGKCIICGCRSYLQIAHYISRGRLGLGIAKNLGVMCVDCHGQYDNGKYHNEIKKLFEEHLKAHYEEWSPKDLTYNKWRDFNVNTSN